MNLNQALHESDRLECITIPGEVWTAFLEQESLLDRESPGDVTLSAVVQEILSMIFTYEAEE